MHTVGRESVKRLFFSSANLYFGPKTKAAPSANFYCYSPLQYSHHDIEGALGLCGALDAQGWVLAYCLQAVVGKEDRAVCDGEAAEAGRVPAKIRRLCGVDSDTDCPAGEPEAVLGHRKTAAGSSGSMMVGEEVCHGADGRRSHIVEGGSEGIPRNAETQRGCVAAASPFRAAAPRGCAKTILHSQKEDMQHPPHVPAFPSCYSPFAVPVASAIGYAAPSPERRKDERKQESISAQF